MPCIKTSPPTAYVKTCSATGEDEPLAIEEGLLLMCLPAYHI